MEPKRLSGKVFAAPPVNIDRFIILSGLAGSPGLLLCGLLLLLTLTGCQAVGLGEAAYRLEARSYPSLPTQPLPLASGQSLQQQFAPSYNGLSQLTLTEAVSGTLPPGTLRLRLHDEAGQLIHEGTLPRDGQLTLTFDPQPNSARLTYTIEIEPQGPEAITLLRSEGERFAGLLRVEEEAQPGDLLMTWDYQLTPGVLTWQAGRGLAHYGLPLLLMGLLWTLPGLALLGWLRPDPALPWSYSLLLGASLALSGALLVLLPQFTELLGVRLGPWAVWLLVGGSLLALLLRRRQGGLGPLTPPDLPTLLYGLLLALLLGSRLLALHPVPAPLWGDSVHHTLITQLLLEHGGLFADYAPYLPLNSLTYHAGFHLLSAWGAWSVLPGMAPLDAEAALLLTGQLLNAGAVVMVGFLVEGLARRAGYPVAGRWAALLCLLLAGLLTRMPAFYSSWGRYTQLAGQFFLPAALLWSLWGWSPQRGRRQLLPLALLVGALALSHYRVLVMYVVAIPLLLLPLAWAQRAAGWPGWRALLGRALGSGALTLLLVLPWYWTLAQGFILRLLGDFMRSSQPNQVVADYNVFFPLTTFMPLWLLWGAGIGALLLLLRRQWAGPLLGLWTLALFIVSNPYTTLGLPGTGIINNFTLQIALYIPLTALASLGLVMGAEWLLGRWPLSPRLLAPALGVGLLLLAGWGAWQQLSLLDVHNHAILTAQDRPALAWVREHTPREAVVHQNGFFAFGGTVVVGSDGGWWLWLTAARSGTVPPIIYTNEASFEPEYRLDTEARFRRLQAAQHDPALLAEALRQEGIEYLYSGARQGRAGLPPDQQALDPLQLQASPHFELLYSNGFAWLFRVR